MAFHLLNPLPCSCFLWLRCVYLMAGLSIKLCPIPPEARRCTQKASDHDFSWWENSPLSLEPYGFASVHVLPLLTHGLMLPGKKSSCWEGTVPTPSEAELAPLQG